MKAILKRFSESTFFNILISSMIPAILIILFIFVASHTYIGSYKEYIKTSYLSKLSTIVQYNEDSLNNISHLFDNLHTDANFMSVVSGYNKEMEKVKYVCDLFGKIKRSNSMIDSIIAVDRSSKKVYTTDGVEDMNNFFSDSFVYDDYNYEYWYSYQSAFSSKNIFPPARVNHKGLVDNVIPIVFTKIAGEPFGNIIIVNIKLSSLKKGFDNEKISNNGKLMMFSLSRQNLYSTDRNVMEEASTDFSAQILSDKKTAFDYEINGEKSFIISYTPRISILGYAYVAVVPYRDMNGALYDMLTVLSMLGLGILVMAFVLAYFGAKKVFKPILELSSKFSNRGEYGHKDNVIKQVSAEIDKIMFVNNELTTKRREELPLLQEWYLIKFLNANEEYGNVIEEKQDISFEYDMFCCVVFQIKPTKYFYEYYDRAQYNVIYNAISDLIVHSFEQFYKTYVIPAESDVIYLVLNFKEEIRKIAGIILNIKNILHNDKEYISCNCNCGGIYKGLEGLKKSHNESIENIYSVSKIDRIEIVSRQSAAKGDRLKFSQNEEIELFNCLFTIRVDDALTLINNIVERNLKRNISKSDITNMYGRIAYIILKVLHEKKIPYDTEGIGDNALISKITDGPNEEIHKKLTDMVNSVRTYGNEKLGFSNIVDYIQTHYMEDLCLENLSEIFGLSPKYISKLFKEEMGVNFKDYLITLRVNNAIELLKKDKSVTEIYKLVGFNNRNTFNRIFKAKTGLTPTEYRKEMEQ